MRHPISATPVLPVVNQATKDWLHEPGLTQRASSPDRGRPRDPPPVDSYIPPGRVGRRRSRSPRDNRYDTRSPPRNETWRTRRSPPPTRRYDSRESYPPRDAYSRSDRGDYLAPASRYPRGRSSTPQVRGRELSPDGRPMRSPPPPRRERVASPPLGYGRARRSFLYSNPCI